MVWNIKTYYYDLIFINHQYSIFIRSDKSSDILGNIDVHIIDTFSLLFVILLRIYNVYIHFCYRVTHN